LVLIFFVKGIKAELSLLILGYFLDIESVPEENIAWISLGNVEWIPTSVSQIFVRKKIFELDDVDDTSSSHSLIIGLQKFEVEILINGGI